MLQFLAVCMLIFNVYRQYLESASLTARRLVSILILFGGSGVAFAFHPIYEGDFSHQYREISLAGAHKDAFEQGLTMIALPGCGFCFEKLEEMKYVKKLYPQLPMHVLVINQDELALESYREESEGLIEVDFFPESTLLKNIITDGFPNLIYKPSGTDQKLINWSNSGFGSASWDYVLTEEGL
ncbi:hypothetical protein CW751_07705 [Brumimicrobium salinarum]|uniref:Uncharacterized protein n=2 Tax=Brumimicrobium salinarum TaxID=2058658 RepID=A0A2I0R3A3_9FLAO|nr:hypothetical protein CW751_07705 [Brumimicrobium salinarum]